ncbi:hypothetical protein BDP81DRAFT_430978 [Colletotrichum phormii]|uniref:Uncharacterized protein n=1 Tax=Colletotrichum phormii TaxID=359342 RepID=A0AAI9ZNC7_9PEZI|nr:uncharacterized protein BDP81DRAFT_430978 [Colletotrichum phormii]KAK1635187.1 hypothetical protein BDP81DRAFT_430978 [Colletotrichum phormii]
MAFREDVKLNRLRSPEPEYVLLLIPSLRTVSFLYFKLSILFFKSCALFPFILSFSVIP